MEVHSIFLQVLTFLRHYVLDLEQSTQDLLRELLDAVQVVDAGSDPFVNPLVVVPSLLEVDLYAVYLQFSFCEEKFRVSLIRSASQDGLVEEIVADMSVVVVHEETVRIVTFLLRGLIAQSELS